MQHIGLYTRLKPGMEEAYERMHASVPDEVALDLQVRGVIEWRIWRRDRHLFHFVECEDYDAFTRSAPTNAAAAGWGEHVSPYLEVHNDPRRPRHNEARLLWSLSRNGS